MQIICIDKAYEKMGYYNKELYVLWISEVNGKKFYHCSDVKDDVVCKVYLGESQVKINHLI